jgi:hypothetical protein
MANAHALAPRVVVALALSTVAAPSFAQHAGDRGWLHVAGYRPTIRSQARADDLATERPGTVVNFEEELGLADRKTLPWVQAGARLGERWRAEIEYFSLRRDGSRSVERDIEWDGVVYPASATLASQFYSDVLRVGFGYSFVRSPNAELGAVLGLHATRFRVSLDGKAAVGDFTGSGQSQAEEALVPLPTIGLFGRWDLGPAWSVSGRVDVFSLSTGDYSGRLVNAMVDVDWRATERFAVSVGYRYVDYSLDVERSTWRGGIDYRFNGPFLGLKAGF